MELPVSHRRFLRRWLMEGPLGRVVGPAYGVVVGVELLGFRFLDAVSGSMGPFEGSSRGWRPSGTDPAGCLTAVIKAFERPKSLRRLCSSIRRRYPTMEIVVVDDSRNPTCIEGVTTVLLPYDSGVGAGRKEGLGRVRTRYFLLLDDDFIFCRFTRLEPAVALMESHPEIDIMGGKVYDLPFMTTHDYRKDALFDTTREPLLPPGSLVGDLEVMDKVANFFIGRTDRVRMVDWDPALKRIDHADFFTRARGKLCTVFNPALGVLHARSFFDVEYRRAREDFAGDLEVLRQRYPCD